MVSAFGLKERKRLNKRGCEERGVVACDGGAGGFSLIRGVSASPSLLVPPRTRQRTQPVLAVFSYFHFPIHCGLLQTSSYFRPVGVTFSPAWVAQ